MRGITIPPGTPLFAEGDDADSAYLIEEGWVEIFTEQGGRRRSLALVGPGEIFGEMGVIDGSPRSASAATVDLCRLLVFTAERFHAALDRGDPFHVELLRKMVSRFRGAQSAAIEGNDHPRLESSTMGLGYAELAQERDIAEAVQSSRIEAQFQPIVELSSGRMLGYEALARWRRTDNELVAPQGFLPLAERTGLIRDIDFVMARQAMCFAGTLADRTDGPYVNINFSARHFHDPDDIGLATRLTKMLATTRLDAHRVHIELTESLMIKDPAAAERQLKELSAHGFKIALDDFGTGYSSLSVLHRMPIDILKIDCSLVRDIANSARARSVLRSIVGVASDLDMEVVAEGIEDEATMHALLELGCHRGQGFHFAVPLHARDILARRNTVAEGPPLSPSGDVAGS